MSSTADAPRPPHLLFVVNNYPPHVGGVERYLEQLTRSLVRAGVRVTVVTLAPAPGEAIEHGVRVIRLRGHIPIAGVIGFPAPMTARRLVRRLSGEDVSAVSVHTRFFPMSFVGMRVAHRLRVPLIHTEHGAGFVVTRPRPLSWAARLVDLTVGRRVLRSASRVVAISDEVAAFVASLAGRDSVVLPNAVAVSDWRPTRAQQGPPPSPRLVFVGRLVPNKGWDEFLRIGARLIGSGAFLGLRLDVVGDGADRIRAQDTIQGLGIEDRVSLHGQLDEAGVRGLLEGAVLVNPSRLAEGFQMTVLEAVLMGCQVASYPVPSVGPLLADGAPIRVVASRREEDLLHAVMQCLSDPLPAMPESARGRWDWSTRAAEFLDLVLSRAH